MKVCFFSPTAYSYFDQEKRTWAGGAEVQQVLVAKYMASKGLDVSFIVGDYGQADAEIVNGITLIKSFEPRKGNRKLRFLPDMHKIKRAMRIADADIYNQRSTSFYTGQMAFFTRQLGKIFTFSIGSDYNCYRDCGGHLGFPMTVLHRYGIRHANAVIAQTERQRGLIRENFGRDAELIRNGVRIPANQEQAADGTYEPEFLWVGAIRRLKQPELYLEMAEKIPEARFTLIGSKVDEPRFYDEIVQRAAGITNVTFAGYVPPDRIEAYYRRSFALVNTSYLEGFPNTYLYAWIYGVPALTIEIDPDGIIEKYGIGRRTGSIEGLVEAARALLDDRALRDQMSSKAKLYVAENHDLVMTAEKYIGLFENLLAGRRI
jgi:glycosyltransferase involved in cell wall biosynthesis